MKAKRKEHSEIKLKMSEQDARNLYDISRYFTIGEIENSIGCTEEEAGDINATLNKLMDVLEGIL